MFDVLPTMRRHCSKIAVLAVIVGFLVFVLIDALTKSCKRPETGAGNNTACEAGQHAAEDACDVATACLVVAVEAFTDWLAFNPVVGALCLTIFYAISTVLLVPGSLLTLGAGATYASALGLGLGVLVCSLSVLLGASLGALVAFVLGRHVLRGFVQQLLQKWRITSAVDAALAVDGLKVMLLFRLSPLVPFSATNYVMAGTSISLRKYALALLGIVPGTVAYVYIGASVVVAAETGTRTDSQQVLQVVLLVGGAVLAFAAVFAISWYARKVLRAAVKEQETGAV